MLNEGLQFIQEEAFAGCSSLEHVQFPSISKRVKNLLGAYQSEIQDKIANIQHFEWSEDDLLVSLEAIKVNYPWRNNWTATKTHRDHILSWISYYELKEATSTIELAMWKAKIAETGALSTEDRDACRVNVPGPARDAILQYLK